MSRPKLISITNAIKLASVYGIKLSRPTIINHAYREKYGHQLGGKGGKWVINKEKFVRFIRGTNNITQYNQDNSKTSFEKNSEEKGRNHRTSSNSDTNPINAS